MKPIAIIGGGITGLTAAFRLRQKNLPVTLYEASARVGGVIETGRHQGYLAECGPNTILETSPKIGATARGNPANALVAFTRLAGSGLTMSSTRIDRANWAPIASRLWRTWQITCVWLESSRMVCSSPKPISRNRRVTSGESGSRLTRTEVPGRTWSREKKGERLSAFSCAPEFIPAIGF
jgi:hypothetical protein